MTALNTWTAPNVAMPEPGRTVRCRLSLIGTDTIQEHLLVRVLEDDVDWRTADDHSEVSYAWSVVEWTYDLG